MDCDDSASDEGGPTHLQRRCADVEITGLSWLRSAKDSTRCRRRHGARPRPRAGLVWRRMMRRTTTTRRRHSRRRRADASAATDCTDVKTRGLSWFRSTKGLTRCLRITRPRSRARLERRQSMGWTTTMPLSTIRGRRVRREDCTDVETTGLSRFQWAKDSTRCRHHARPRPRAGLVRCRLMGG
jgi:hypothetical protein